LYRLVALAALRKRVDLGDADRLAALATRLNVRFAPAGELERVYLDDTEVAAELRTEQAGEAASRVAAVPAVRTALLQRQRDFARWPGLVADGRDMGSVVFPTATLKVFLTASAEERAMRRHKQLKEKGIDVSLPDLSWTYSSGTHAMQTAPWRRFGRHRKAHVIDSTSLSPKEVVARILEWLAAVGVGIERA